AAQDGLDRVLPRPVAMSGEARAASPAPAHGAPARDSDSDSSSSSSSAPAARSSSDSGSDSDSSSSRSASAAGPAAAAAERARPAEPPAEAAAAEASRQSQQGQTETFTPRTIHAALCMARIWNEGYGAQCSHKGLKWPCGRHLCAQHAKDAQWRIHGLVDGPIPEEKLQEFLRHVPTRYALATGGSERDRARHRRALARKDDILAQPEGGDPTRRGKRAEGSAAPEPPLRKRSRRGGEAPAERPPEAAQLELLTEEGLSRMELGAIADLLAGPP
ncbi:unnamed protein product, partial [Prorocentrum cordatum]